MPDIKDREFTEVYTGHYSRVYSAIYVRIDDAEIAGDLTQEVFTRFYEKFDEVATPSKWLMGTMRYVLLEYYRKKYRKDMELDDLFQDVAFTFVNGFREARIMIQDALEHEENFMVDMDKVIFDLVAMKGFSYGEAGEHTGLTKRQVRYRYGLTIRNLQNYFRKQGIHNLEDLL
jgi:RNA polymerase sigma factor (sigma-70 family)